MLTLTFKLGAENYAIDAKWIVEIVPLVPLAPVPQAPEYIAGMFNFRGSAVPVVDLCLLTKKRPSRPQLSTRIILLDYGHGADHAGGAPRVLGVIAERVTEFHNAKGTTPAPLNIPQAPYLGDIFFVASEMNQRLEPAKLLPAELLEMLFAQKTAPAAAGGAGA